ncbi:MAG: sensor domain-containing diguanylate cyclase [Candidatus Baltobacteraceae bacterium]
MQGPLPVDSPAATRASARERLTALVVAFSLVAIGLASLRLRSVPIGDVPGLLPCLTAAGLVALLVSCAILRNQYRASRYAPYAFLAVAYGVCAALIVAYLLTFPGIFSPSGFGLGAQVAAWLWVAWHSAFILLAGVYVSADAYFARQTGGTLRAARIVSPYSLAVTALAALSVEALFLYHDQLPALATRTGYTPVFHALVEQLLIYSAVAVLAALIVTSRLRSTVHLWLAAVLVAFVIDIVVSGEVVERIDTLAWVIGLIEAMFWQCMFLVIQLQHSSDQLAAFANDKRELIEETLRDALSGLYNRRGFDARFDEAMRQSRRAQTPLAILVLDLDHFKNYNDHFGHVAGDEALRAVAKTIGSIANRSTDVCCRVGGEEFAVILRMTDEPSAMTVAERIRSSIMRLHIPHAPNVPLPSVTVSIGVAATDGKSSISPKALYELADNALYRAKRLGRNRIAVAPLPVDPASLRVV